MVSENVTFISWEGMFWISYTQDAPKSRMTKYIFKLGNPSFATSQQVESPDPRNVESSLPIIWN